MSWDPGIVAPINSIAFPCASPERLLVAVEDRLYLLDAVTFCVEWQVSSGVPSNKVRCVCLSNETVNGDTD